jgi:hypothetical protein
VARIDHRDVLTRYLAGEYVETLGAAMRSLPATIDVELAASVVVRMMARTHIVGRQCKAVPARVIRAVLAREVPGVVHLFLRLVVSEEVSDAALQASWQRGLQALLDMDTTYAWGSKQRRAKIAALARDAAMLSAVQGTVAHANADPEPHERKVPLDMLAVLVADGSAASYDALVVHIDAAFTSGDTRLDMLARLRTHATSTPELDRLFSELDAALEARNEMSPALALGTIIGIGPAPLLHFDVRLSSTRKNRNRVPWIQGSFSVDSRSTSWFHVWVSTVGDALDRTTSFSSEDAPGRDTLGIGRCAPSDLPRWLAQVAATLDIAWEPFSVSRSNLRGKKRDAVALWLRRGTR